MAERRIGFFGGAFDPPHLAHVALARQALTQLGLERLHVVPTGSPSHREARLSAAHHRLAMARLAFAELPGVTVDDREIRRAGPSFTVDSLQALQQEYPSAQLVLVIGGDQARAFGRWHRWAEILQIAIISVAGRGQDALASQQFGSEHFPGGRWEPLQTPPMPVSATAIRERIAHHSGIDHLVPASVARYIDQHHLYRNA